MHGSIETARNGVPSDEQTFGATGVPAWVRELQEPRELVFVVTVKTTSPRLERVALKFAKETYLQQGRYAAVEWVKDGCLEPIRYDPEAESWPHGERDE